MSSPLKESSFVSAVVYLHNCAGEITAFLRSLYAMLEKNFQHFEIICVDDGCTDGTCDAVRSLAHIVESAQLYLVRLSSYQGLEKAMLAGCDYAIGDYVMEFDSCQMDYDPQLILEVYQRVLKGFDIVNAAPRQGSHRSSRLFYRLFNRFSASPHKLETNRFRIVSRRALNRIHDENGMILYRKIAYATCGLGNDTLYYQPLSLPSRFDQATKDYRWSTAMDSMIVFTDFAYRLSMFFSAVMAVAAFAAFVYTVVIYFTGQPIAGWTTTMLLLSTGLTGIFIVLSFLVKYISIVIRLQVKEKEYAVSSVEKILRP